MIEQLVARVFYARNVAHFEHWRAKGDGSYAKHIALGEFYADAVDALDALVEVYQGANDLIGNIPVPDTSKSSIVPILEADATWIQENHGGICKGNYAVANLIDELTSVYLRTLYKLRHLK